MASSTVDPDRIKPITFRKVRIVAKIRGFTDEETESWNRDSAPWISVRKPNEDFSSEKARISFGEQSTRDVYEVDYCYEQSEDNGVIFSREIKPLIPRVFDGQNVAIIAYGARGSGKTYTIQGTEEKQGLAALALAAVLTMAEQNQKSIAISFYEVFQDHVYDLLDPTRPEIQVFEDAQGKIKLKGLSQAYVKSISEFHKLCFPECSPRRAVQNVPFEMTRRSHKGLIIHVICNSESSNTKLLGKINFVDLAGYVDARRKTIERLNLFESSRINKSIYALLNVVYALNANEIHVPYRESKLTRMLQDSFRGTNHVLMLNCLNPLFCQDTIHATSLASRAFQGVNRVFTNSMRKSKGSAKAMVPSSFSKGRLGIVSATARKPTISRAHYSGKSSSCLVKGRKLFDEGDHLMTSEQAKAPPNIASVMQSSFLSDIGSAIVPYLQEEEKFISDSFLVTLPTDEESSSLNAVEDTKPIEENDVVVCGESNHSEVTAKIYGSVKTLTYLEDGDNMEKENKSALINKDESPPLSTRLRELSNNLKSLYTSTPLHIKMPLESDSSSSGLVVSDDVLVPRTPVQASRAKDKLEVANCQSETFSTRSTGLKRCLVQDYLQFLNSASKEELKGLQGIGEKRATYILELREESPEPFKNLDDLKDIGLSAKQIKGMMKKVAGELFS